MKKFIVLIIILLVVSGGIGFAYKLGYLRKEEVKYVTFSYEDGIYEDYKCKIKEGKLIAWLLMLLILKQNLWVGLMMKITELI